MNTSRASQVLLLICLGFSLTGCGVKIEDRLLSVDAYHVEFKASRGDLTPAAKAAEADAWRAQVRAAADRVAQTVTAGNVYGDEALWNPILTATNATTTRCEFTNNSARSLSVTAGQGDQIREASIQAALLNPGPISGVGSCNMSQSDRLRAFDLIATSFAAGVPTSDISTLDIASEPPPAQIPGRSSTSRRLRSHPMHPAVRAPLSSPLLSSTRSRGGRTTSKRC